MLKIAKKVIKKSFNMFGLDIRKIERNKFVWLNDLNIKTVFDIGANIGQFARMIHNVLPEASIYSFEPLEDCYKQLQSNMKDASNFRAFKFALGDKDTEMDIHRSEYSASSSLLKMGKLHKQAFPYTNKEGIEKIKVKRLDDIIHDLKVEDNILIKIDVQGYEDRVILGGKKLFSKAKVLIVETSFQILYETQPLFDTIYELLKQDFKYMGNLGQLKNPINGSILQSDSIFINNIR
jgi:FkbM family methyltransferase